MEDIIILSTLSNVDDDDTKIMLLNKLKDTKEMLCDSFRMRKKIKNQYDNSLERKEKKNKKNNHRRFILSLWIKINDKTKKNDANNNSSWQELLLEDWIQRCAKKKMDGIHDEDIKKDVPQYRPNSAFTIASQANKKQKQNKQSYRKPRRNKNAKRNKRKIQSKQNPGRIPWTGSKGFASHFQRQKGRSIPIFGWKYYKLLVLRWKADMNPVRDEKKSQRLIIQIE